MWRLGLKKIDSNTKIGNECCTLAWVEIWDTYGFSTSSRTGGDPSFVIMELKIFPFWLVANWSPDQQ
jgi:hypothetical protein